MFKFSPRFACAALSAILLAACSAPMNPAALRAPVNGLQAYNNPVRSFAGVKAPPRRFATGLNTSELKPLTESDAFSTMASLPERVDLRPQFQPIYNQNNTSACVGFAAVGGLGEFIARKRGQTQRFSPWYLWHIGRKLESHLNSNDGMYFSTAMKIMDNYGMLPEADFSYPPAAITADQIDPALLARVPGPALIDKAKKMRISQGWQWVTSVHGIKKALANGVPVVFGITIFESIGQTYSNGGLIPIPRPGEKVMGGHAIVAVGYDNAKRHIIIRNSWGEDFGDKGYAYLPYDALRVQVEGHPVAYGGFTIKY